MLSFLTGGRKLANARRNERAAVSTEAAGDVAWNAALLGTVEVVNDSEHIDAAEEWIYHAYDGAATDGSSDYALVEFTVGSAALSVYDRVYS